MKWLCTKLLVTDKQQRHIGVSFTNWDAVFILGQTHTMSYLAQAEVLKRLGSADGCSCISVGNVRQDLWFHGNC